MIYAELSKRDMYRKEQREKHEVEDRILKNDERNQVLNWQKEEALRARQAELDRIEAEKRMLVYLNLRELFKCISERNLEIRRS